MANAFQDQFLKAGLVKKNKVDKVKRTKHKTTKQQGKHQEVDESKKLAQKALQEKAERDRELNRQKEENAQQKGIAAQIKQLIQINMLDEEEGDIGFKFTDNKLIKTIYVSEKVQQQLSDGRLAIVRLDAQYAVVPCPVAEKIRQRDESCILVCNDNTANTDTKDDDDYAKYQILDDLMW